MALTEVFGSLEDAAEDASYTHMMNRELYPVKRKVVGKSCSGEPEGVYREW